MVPLQDVWPSAWLLAPLLLLLLTVSALLWRGQKRPVAALLGHYLAMKMVAWLGHRQRRLLEASTLDVRRVQEGGLLCHLRLNQHTEWGQRHRFKEVTDADSFRQLHPLTQYGDYAELIHRVIQGVPEVLTAERPCTLTLRPPSSEWDHVYLCTPAANVHFFLQGSTVWMDATFHAFPSTWLLQRSASFGRLSAWRRAESWMPAGVSVGSWLFRRLHAAPFQMADERDALYVELLLALKDPTLEVLEAASARELCAAFATLQERWQELIEDIRVGTLSQRLELEQDLRQQVNGLLYGDAHRADDLCLEFEKGFRGIARRLWPNLKLVAATLIGPNQLYGAILQNYCCQDVPIYSPVYTVAEGLVGVNIWPEKPVPTYLLCPGSIFCEFIPDNSWKEKQPKTLLMDEVEVDSVYELVVSGVAGLCRFRTGDVVKVTGFHNQCPIVEFKYRRGQTLNLRGEQTTEEMFVQALQSAVRQWAGAELVDYGCAESSLAGSFSVGSDHHYEVFVELVGIRNLSEDQRLKLDHSLQETSATYKSLRFRGSVGPAQVQLVRGGSFRELHRHLLNECPGTPASLEVPRVLRRREHVSFLQSRIIS
ncbi:GH3 domain-containing protein [Polypterus senegalus]|uniref:GH3 domain-containing protein n=1 Tax=Polypterus senegalus TaxID=55291 RepID=UPI001965974C|nr:GH3 domain-containing protein [Polypterus senegalus]XP_039595932.1 GH3 domain-containing protein [Polypterus senegalus]